MYSAKSTLCGRALYKSVIYYLLLLLSAIHQKSVFHGCDGQRHDFQWHLWPRKDRETTPKRSLNLVNIVSYWHRDSTDNRCSCLTVSLMSCPARLQGARVLRHVAKLARSVCFTNNIPVSQKFHNVFVRSGTSGHCSRIHVWWYVVCWYDRSAQKEPTSLCGD